MSKQFDGVIWVPSVKIFQSRHHLGSGVVPRFPEASVDSAVIARRRIVAIPPWSRKRSVFLGNSSQVDNGVGQTVRSSECYNQSCLVRSMAVVDGDEAAAIAHERPGIPRRVELYVRKVPAS